MSIGNISADLYRQVIDGMADAIAIVDSELCLRMANRAFCQLCERSEADILGTPMFGPVLTVLAQARLEMLLQDASGEGRILDRVPVEALLGSGRRSFILSARPLGIDTDGETLSLLFLRDNHWSRATNAAETIDSTNKQLVEINHRVKNNLGAILAMLRLEGRGAPDGASKELLSRIGMRVQAIASLYEILSIERRAGVVGLLRYLRTVARSIEQVAGSGRGGWVIDVAGDDIDVTIDEAARYGAIVNELVSNAVKYAFSDVAGGGHIHIGCERRGDTVEVTIADSGCGISHAAPAPPSTGLGIRLVDLYLHALEGEMERSTVPGRGTTCILRIPYRPIAVDAPTRDEAVEATTASRTAQPPNMIALQRPSAGPVPSA